MKPELAKFSDVIARRLEKAGCEVVVAPVCRIQPEFRAAVAQFDKGAVDGIVTLHLAYSPSLEAIDALEKTKVPILALDTTPDTAFGPKAGNKELFRDHGIHGLQDLTSVMLRRGRPYSVICGPCDDPKLYARAASWARAAKAARLLQTLRVGVMGKPFRGMGDFAVTPQFLRRALGPQIVSLAPSDLVAAKRKVPSQAVRAEMKRSQAVFDTRKLPQAVFEDAERTYLALRDITERRRLQAYTMNFGDMVCAPPFYAVSKLMAEGVGYAGEGDVLTASFVAAVRRIEPTTTFTEMFCPDFRGNTIFMSHMGEFSPAFALQKRIPVIEKDYAFGEGRPAVMVPTMAPGPATHLNLAPVPEGRLRIIASLVQIPKYGLQPGLQSPHFRIRPSGKVADFLAGYSEAGGTHHSAIGRGDLRWAARQLATMLSIDYVEV
jgi:L-arabinose isomerase